MKNQIIKKIIKENQEELKKLEELLIRAGLIEEFYSVKLIGNKIKQETLGNQQKLIRDFKNKIALTKDLLKWLEAKNKEK